jgi:serralysin
MVDWTGGSGDDDFIGTAGDDYARGGDGWDELFGLEGADVLYGNGGDDWLTSEGVDYVDLNAYMDHGTAYDRLYGGAGNDSIAIGYGDYADGGAGDRDYLLIGFGGAPAGVSLDWSAGMAGVSTLPGGGEIRNIEYLVQLWGSEFDDHFVLPDQVTYVSVDAGGGDDVVETGGNGIYFNGGSGNDLVVVGSEWADHISGGPGSDTVSYAGYAERVSISLSGTRQWNGDELTSIENAIGTDYNDYLSGNDLANRLSGGDGRDSLSGGLGNDVLIGGAGDDSMTGGRGNDIYYVDSVGDTVTERSFEGDDIVYSTVTYSILTTHVENLILQGSDDIDATGNNFSNALVGNDGDNVLDGMGKSDVLTGGGGADLFLFTMRPGVNNVDRITDFAIGEDRIGLDSAIFGISEGALLPSAFRVGTAAHDATDRIVYNPGNGGLFYDADGSGAGAAVLFAVVEPGLALSSADFVVV